MCTNCILSRRERQRAWDSTSDYLDLVCKPEPAFQKCMFKNAFKKYILECKPLHNPKIYTSKRPKPVACSQASLRLCLFVQCWFKQSALCLFVQRINPKLQTLHPWPQSQARLRRLAGWLPGWLDALNTALPAWLAGWLT